MRKNYKVITKTKEYIQKHLHEDIKLDDIAKAIGYSKFHLNRMFADCTGETIHKYITKLRLSNAACSLIETNKSIVDIAYESGYESQQAFTVAFRQHYNYTPQVYRQYHRDCVVMAA